MPSFPLPVLGNEGAENDCSTYHRIAGIVQCVEMPSYDGANTRQGSWEPPLRALSDNDCALLCAT